MLTQNITEKFILHQSIVCFLQIPREAANTLGCTLSRGHAEDILIDTFRRFNLVDDTVHSCSKHHGKGEVRVTGRIRTAQLGTGTFSA